jgi:hypothetical protein
MWSPTVMDERGLDAVKASWAILVGAGAGDVAGCAGVRSSTMIMRTMTRAITDADPLVPIGLQATPPISTHNKTQSTHSICHR